MVVLRMAQRILLKKLQLFRRTLPLVGGSTRALGSRASDGESINGLRVEKVDGCVLLRMERGENRLNGEFYRSMHKALDLAESYEDATALITTGGGGGKHYSLGLDLEELSALSPPEKVDFFNEFQRLMHRTLTFPMVTVAAINGHVYAGGAFFAMMHDYRVMRSEKGWYCLPEINLGMIFTAAMFQMLRSLLPQPALHKAVVLGQRYTAEEAKEAKLIDEVCSLSELEETALSTARRLAGEGGLDRRTLAAMKRHLYEDLCSTLNDPVKFYYE